MDTTQLLQTLQVFQLFLQTSTIGIVLYVPLLFIAADIVTGCMAAVRQGVFNWKKLADFWGKSLLVYVVVLLLMLLCFLLGVPQLAVAISSTIGMSSFVASTLASIIENLKETGVSPQVIQEVEQVATDLVRPLYSMSLPPDTLAPPPVLSPYNPPNVQKASTPVPITMQPTADIPVVQAPVDPAIVMPTGL